LNQFFENIFRPVNPLSPRHNIIFRRQILFV
jgi:hypothetical protein